VHARTHTRARVRAKRAASIYQTASYSRSAHVQHINTKFTTPSPSSRIHTLPLSAVLSSLPSRPSHVTCHTNIKLLYISIAKPTRCANITNLFYFRMTLYMFRTVFPSVIRSSRLYTQQQAFVKQILLTAC